MITNIQALRALAALLVVVAHCEALLFPLTGSTMLAERFGVGVDLFFVISGFIMAHTTQVRTPTPEAFIRNRVARVVPLYWLVTVCTFAVALGAGSLMQTTQANVPDLLRSLLFIPYARADGTMQPILFVGWSLNYEMMFYLIFAAGLTIRDGTRRVLVVAGALLGLIGIGWLLRGMLSPVIGFITAPILIEFALGMLLALIYPRLPRARALGIAAAVASPVLIALLIGRPMTHWPLAGLPAALLVLCALVMERGRLDLHAPLVVLLGDASYSLYLTHPFVAVAITKVALRLGLASAATALPLVVLVLVAASIAGILTYRLVEMPLSRVSRRLLGVARQVPAARGL